MTIETQWGCLTWKLKGKAIFLYIDVCLGTPATPHVKAYENR